MDDLSITISSKFALISTEIMVCISKTLWVKAYTEYSIARSIGVHIFWIRRGSANWVNNNETREVHVYFDEGESR